MSLDYKYSTILKVALPMMFSGFIQSVVLITDASFISRYSTIAFDAVGNAGLIYITFYMLIVGVGDGAQIIMARRIGENKHDMLSRVFSAGLFFQLMFSGLLFLFMFFLIPDWITTYSLNQNIATLQGDYIGIRSMAIFPACLFLMMQAYFLAKGKTFPVLIAAVFTASLNILLDYSLIFGHFGFPEMGVKGAALASTCSDLLGMLTLLCFFVLDKEHVLTRLRFFKLKSLVNLLKISSPIMLQGSLALGTWTIFFIMLEQRGLFELTVSQNIRSIYFLAFVPVWGFAGTTKTYISQYMGGQKESKIPIIQKRIQLLTTGFLIFFFHGAILYPEALIGIINPEDAYIDMSAQILRLISVSIILYGIISVYYQTILGSGNTIYSLIIEITTILLYLSACYLFIQVLNFEIFWIWTVEYIYFGTIGIMSVLYLRNSGWKNKIV
jgi:putative MATE family efflux protein